MSRNPLAYSMVVILSMSLTGCATIINGRTQTVRFETTPPGAFVEIDGQVFVRAPGDVELVRKRRHSVKIRLEGYEEYRTSLEPRVDWKTLYLSYGLYATIGVATYAIVGRSINLRWCLYSLPYEVPGIFFDILTGAVWKSSADTVSCNLVPIRPSMTVPGPPSGAGSAGPPGPGQITLRWSPAPVPVSGYRIYLARSPDGSLVRAASVPAGMLSIRVTEVDGRVLQAGVSYRAVVRAISIDDQHVEGLPLLDVTSAAQPLNGP